MPDTSHVATDFDDTELCAAAGGAAIEYAAADDIAGRGVTLRATAALPTAGHEPFFRPIVRAGAGDATDPVGFELRVRVRPGGDAVTTRTAEVSVPNAAGGGEVTVWDAAGRRSVPVAVALAGGGGPAADEPAASVTPVRYAAVALPGGRGRLTASGESPTAGVTVFLRAVPEPGAGPLAAPHRFELRQVRPAGVAAQVVTPFNVETGVTGVAPGMTLTVTDAAGEHAVTVASTDDRP